MKNFLLFLFTAVSSQFATGQMVSLDVLMGEKNIGEIIVEKKTKGKTVNAMLNSKVRVSFLIKVNVDQTIVSEYVDGKLMKADMVRVSNISSENKKTAIVWNGIEYNIKRDTLPPFTHKEPVTYCVVDLYFIEPVSITKVFGETGGTYMPIKHLGDHRYELQVNDSKKDIFVYGSNGKLLQIETVIAMKKVVFKVRENAEQAIRKQAIKGVNKESRNK